MTKMKMRAKEMVGELEDDGDTSENDGGTLETMEALWRRWRHFRDDLLMDRAVLGARVRWEPNLTETKRGSRSLFLF